MKRKLDVYLHRQLAGHLFQDQHGQMTFDYADSWREAPSAVALSRSLPPSKKHFVQNDCRAFFAGVLPEEDMRTVIARNLGISARNDFSMLEQIGGECAGAVTFIPAGQQLPSDAGDYEDLTERTLADTLQALPQRPLLAGRAGIRLSLAGAQNKIAVRVSGKEISIPRRGAPSTHILKPAIDRFAGSVFNEAFCMKLARSIGLNVANVETGKAGSIDYLLVERYDRIVAQAPDGQAVLKRLHQEDFCQALGIVPEYKYQAEGGPSLKQCFDLVRDASSAPVIDLQALLDSVIFNFLTGNHDAHGKNFSLLYRAAGDTRIAPIYDVLSTIYYPQLSEKMAMKIGGEYVAARIGLKHFERLAEEAGLAKPMVRRRVLELAEFIRLKLPDQADNAIAWDVARLMEGNCERTIRRFRG